MFKILIPTMLLEREQHNACGVLDIINTAVTMDSTISAALVLNHILNIDPDYNTPYLLNAKELGIIKIEIKRCSSCSACTMKTSF